MLQMNIKTFILICSFALSIPLFLAIQNLTDEGESVSTLDLGFNSTSKWAQIRIEGANIVNIDVLTPEADVIYSNNNIFLNGPGKARIEAKISAYQSPVRFHLSKDPMGQVFVEIGDLGVLKNVNQPITLPIHIRTNSSLAKLNLQGMSIEGAKLNNSSNGRSVYPIIEKNSIYLENPDKRQIELNLTTNITFDDDLTTVVLEKENDGTFWAKIGNYVYYNNKTGELTVKDLPVMVETTSNKTQIIFDDSEISQGKIISVDGQDLQTSILGNNFIFLSYSHDGNSFRRANYLLDLNLSQKSKLTIYKNNSGFVSVKLGEMTYFCTDFDEDTPYVYKTYDLKIVPNKKDQKRSIYVPVTIETTSDWTDVSFDGLKNLKLVIKDTKGDIGLPVVSGDKISIHKNTEDISFAGIEATLWAEEQRDGKLKIEKGDLGSTTVKLGDLGIFVNAENIKRDPRNDMVFALPILPKKVEDYTNIIYNPVAYIFPVYGLLYESGASIEETQPKEVSLAITADDLPGWSISMSDPVAKGVVSYVFVSYLVLGVFGLLVLIREGHFKYPTEKKVSIDYIWKLMVNTVETLPISSILILEALIALAITPFLLLKSDAMANGTAILAYLLLVLGVAIRFAEMKELLNIDKQKERLVKLLCLSVLLAAGYIGVFELPTTPIILDPNGLFSMLIITGIFLLLLYLSITRENLWALVMNALEKISISSILIFEALATFAITPFISSENDIAFKGASILAYLFLVGGIVARLVEANDKLYIEEQKEMLIKALLLAIFVAGGYFGAFKLLKTPISIDSGGLVVMLIITGVFLLMAYLYLKEYSVRDEDEVSEGEVSSLEVESDRAPDREDQI